MSRARSSDRFDVAVVGSGPAGSAAAFELAQAGHRVLMLEKMDVPRYKTCGGGLVGRAVQFLPFDVAPAVERECRRVDVAFTGMDLNFSVRRDHPIVWMTMRDRLDAIAAWHAADAGAELVTGCRVDTLRFEHDMVTLSTDRGTFRASFVIGADGATGIVARQAGWKPAGNAIPALEHEITVADDVFRQHAKAARFDFGAAPFGYGWIFPKRAHLSVGVLTTRRGRVPLQQYLQQYLVACGIERVESVTRHGYVIPLLPVARSFMRNRTLLVGDAAGFADPITAEGISFAILSGQLAARALTDGALDAGSVRRRFHAYLRKHVLRDLTVARRFAHTVYDPSLVGVRLLERFGQEVAERMMDVFSGASTYRTALAPTRFLPLVPRSLRRTGRREPTGIA